MAAPRVAPLLASHRARVEEILRATGAFRDEEVTVALELVDDATGAAPSGDYACLAAFGDAGALTGYACFGPAAGTDGTWDLYWIATDPAVHGGGHGRALLAAVERAVAERGGRLVVAETSSRDDYGATRSFYHKAGYAAEATVADFYAPGDGRVLFVKRVGAARARADAFDASGRTSLSTPTGAPQRRGAAAR